MISLLSTVYYQHDFIRYYKMQQIGNFFKKAFQSISEKTAETLEIAAIKLSELPDQPSEQQNTSITPQLTSNKHEETESKHLSGEEKVLQIDVIESGYIIKSQEQINPFQKKTNLEQLPLKKESHVKSLKSSEHPSRLRQIQEEKRRILEELKLLDQEIEEIRGESIEDGTLKRREKEQENEQANKQAKNLVKNLKAQKKELEEKRRKEAQKSLLLIKQQEEERKAKQTEQALRVKQERRKAIEARMEEDRKKKQERRLMEKQSNRLLKQLKKEEEIGKQKEELPQQTNEVELRKKIVERKNEVNFREIEEHERRYMEMKERSKLAKKERAESVGKSIPQYQKNRWLEIVEEQEQKRREEEKIKELQRKETLEKRKKYGELVKNIFIPKTKKERSQESKDRDLKPSTPDTNLLPRIPDSQKRVTDSKPMKKFMEQNKPFATAHPKPPKPQSALRKEEPEDLEKEKERKAKEAEMRRITKQRLKKLENRSLQALPQNKSRPKYQNYLGKVKVRGENEAASWKKVIDNQKMSKEDKYKQMMRRAAAMENKAKIKEEVTREGDQSAVNLYIGSIQAKLAILQQF